MCPPPFTISGRRANVYTNRSLQKADVKFTWDERKSRANQHKHGISLTRPSWCSTIRITYPGRIGEIEGEPRWQTIGVVNGVYVLLVAHTVEGTEDELFGSSQRERQRLKSGGFMAKASRAIKVKRIPGQPLTAKQKRELTALAAMPDEQVNTTDSPELPPDAWKAAVRGRFYRPIKRAVSLRLDSDVVAWLKKEGRGYQTRANRILRERMLTETRKRA